MDISIHAPRVGSDSPAPAPTTLWTDFNPRSPCGERPNRPHTSPHTTDFNPRSPCGERQMLREAYDLGSKFQSTLPVWGATAKLHKYFLKFYRI